MDGRGSSKTREEGGSRKHRAPAEVRGGGRCEKVEETTALGDGGGGVGSADGGKKDLLGGDSNA